MKLLLKREEFTDTTTRGTLYVNDKEFCNTLEDTDRRLEEHPERKLYGRTAIPRGAYEVRLSMSNRFKRLLPEVYGVSGFVGVRIHAGNTHEDTEGCILVGVKDYKDSEAILNSRATLLKLMVVLEDWVEGGKDITLEVT